MLLRKCGDCRNTESSVAGTGASTAILRRSDSSQETHRQSLALMFLSSVALWFVALSPSSAPFSGWSACVSAQVLLWGRVEGRVWQFARGNVRLHVNS